MMPLPSATKTRSRKRLVLAALSAVAVTSLAVALAVRYTTFDAKHFVSEVETRLNPMRPTPPAAPGATGSAASEARLLGPLPTDPAERVRQFETTMAAMNERYHPPPGLCFRYPTKEDGSARSMEKADEVADALLAADLAGRLDALVPASAKWALDADNAKHAAAPEVEVVEYFADEAGLWTQLGVAMHRTAVQDIMRRALEQKPPPPVQGVPLSAEEEARARPLAERYGHLELLQGAMRVGARLHLVDLRAPRLRLVEPGMSQSAVRTRLGPAEEDGLHWRYPRMGTEVSFNEQGVVTGVVSLLTFGDQVLVDGAAQRSLDESSLARLMGKPLSDAVGEQGEPVLVYPAGPYAMLLVFAGQLARVELWQRDLVVSARR